MAKDQNSIIDISDRIAFFTKTIEDAVANDQLEDAIAIMCPFLEPIDDQLAKYGIHFSARIKALNQDRSKGLLTSEEYSVNRAKIRMSMVDFVGGLHEQVHIKQQLRALVSPRDLSAGTPEPPISVPQGIEEKILGGQNEMFSIVWLAKAILASKSVCRVLVGGRPEGTGFLLKGGLMMTNAHVLPTDEDVAKTTIEFNFEDGQNKTVRYKLAPKALKRSPKNLLDYCVVEVIDNPESPLKKWGYVELETEVELRENDPVNIVQHPNGGIKQLTFRANKVISIWDQKVFYTADTDNGSSGSPVFNDSWKVVALHSRGASEKDGGMQVDKSGTVSPANQGFSIVTIAAELGLV